MHSHKKSEYVLGSLTVLLVLRAVASWTWGGFGLTVTGSATSTSMEGSYPGASYMYGGISRLYPPTRVYLASRQYCDPKSHNWIFVSGRRNDVSLKKPTNLAVWVFKVRNKVASEVEVVCCRDRNNARTRNINGMALIWELLSQMRTNQCKKEVMKPRSRLLGEGSRRLQRLGIWSSQIGLHWGRLAKERNEENWFCNRKKNIIQLYELPHPPAVHVGGWETFPSTNLCLPKD